MTVIAERDASTVQLLQSALGGGGTVVASLEAADDHLDQHPDEYVVVVGPSIDAEAAADFAQRWRVLRPALGVVLVRARIDSGVLATALRSGMREVVESRDLTGLTEAVRRAYGLWQAMSSTASGGTGDAPTVRGRLLTVFSTKGGVGKSMLTTNLAAALAEQGLRVCVVDLDVQSGDVAIMLQLFPTRSLGDLASMSGAVDRSTVESLLTEHSERLSVVAAPPSLDATEKVSAETVGQVLQVVKGMFDVVVVDTSGSFDDHALQALDHSELVLLIGTLDIPALKSLKLATDTLDLLNIPRSHWRLVLNRADAKVGLTTSEFGETLGLEIATSLPSSRDVLASVNRGEPIVKASPRHPASQSIKAFARTLVGESGHDSDASGGRRQKESTEPRRGLLHRKGQ